MKIEKNGSSKWDVPAITEEERRGQFNAQDITELFLYFQEKHRNVFVQKIENEIFIYRSLGRAEYKKILSDEQFNDMEKEELICQICTLYPENYDFENCDAGIPTVLAKNIIRNSYLDSIESRRRVLDYYREEMFDLDNQITCIINEAFPQFDIEEIESWGIEKTMKYLSRAEWKLHNLRGLEIYDPGMQESYYEVQDKKAKENKKEVQTEEIGVEKQEQENNKTDKEEKNLRGGKKEKLTPEKLQELKAKFPEIDWENDAIMKYGIDGLKDTTVPPALRPGLF